MNREEIRVNIDDDNGEERENTSEEIKVNIDDDDDGEELESHTISYLPKVPEKPVCVSLFGSGELMDSRAKNNMIDLKIIPEDETLEKTNIISSKTFASEDSIASKKSSTTHSTRSREHVRPSMLSRHFPGALSSLSRSRVMETEVAKRAFAADAAECISEQLTILGLIAALLSSWGVSVYSGEPPPNDGLCFGPNMVKATYCLFWISLGFFFVTVSSTLVIMSDIDGVPQRYLAKHLTNPNVQRLYMIPELSIIGGVIFLAAGYAVDIGERAGCPFFYFGVIAAPSFVGSMALLYYLVKGNRAKLERNSVTNESMFGRHYIATWRDLLDVANGIDEGSAAILCEGEQLGGNFLIRKKGLFR